LRILLLTFYYEPDLCAGSFRAKALVEALLNANDKCTVEVLTTMPNRYASFSASALENENLDRVSVSRIILPRHESGILDQSKAFLSYAFNVFKKVRHNDYDIVVATSSRLMTACLGAEIARKKSIPLYLDIRDIFVDTVKDVFPRWLNWFALPVLSLLERSAILRADKINLVSKGFNRYFKERYKEKAYSFYSNGIDDAFLDLKLVQREAETEKLTVVYAGNIGEGQGLHLILPELAKRLESTFNFRIIGDGGKRKALVSRLSELEVKNVEMIEPIQRSMLIQEYLNADLLFLHLNDLEAFDKVLPSKIFEYAACGKPIWAGIKGYSREFLMSEVENVAIFSPLNLDEAINSLAKISYQHTPRLAFKDTYSRKSISRKLAEDIISTC
jgi:glycosyltransferase involved in cell wall biosynthesis